MSRYAARQLPKSLVDGLYLAFGLRGKALLGLCRYRVRVGQRRLRQRHSRLACA
jgi:hypothetical protein